MNKLIKYTILYTHTHTHVCLYTQLHVHMSNTSIDSIGTLSCIYRSYRSVIKKK